MIDAIIEASVRNRVFVLLVAALLSILGGWAARETPVDAIPDLSDVQVIVETEYMGQSPQVVEDQVTYPLATALLSVPYARDVRGYSMFGTSMVYVLFEDGTDLYWARSRVLEYLNVVQGRLPAGVTPQLGPDATGVGWVYQYTLTDFSPRAEWLRHSLDRDRDGTVAAAELPAPDEGSTYSRAALTKLLTPDGPRPPRSAAEWADDAVRYLHDGFDRDHDGHIAPAELERAANFRGIGLDRLRSLQDWYLRYDLMAVEGVSEIATVGGFVRQYQVEVDPERLRAFGITIGDVTTAIRRANLDAGGRLLEMGETEYMVRGQGYLRSVADLETIPVGMAASSTTGAARAGTTQRRAAGPAMGGAAGGAGMDGSMGGAGAAPKGSEGSAASDKHVPVLLSQVARVQLGPEVRRGLVDLDGQGEAVTGIVVARFGENARAVISRVEARLTELRRGLPEGVEIHTSYDRSQLIDRAVATLTGKLADEMIVVALVCVVFLLHLRSAFVAVVTLPVGVLLSLLAMRLFGVNANIMSLGGIAIAIGVMVDASVVMVENLHKHREREPDADQVDLVVRSAKEVGPALFFSLLIVTVSFLPVFTLEQQEGRLFRPLAWTKTFSMGFSSVLAITLIPALMVYLVRGRIRPEAQNPLSRLFIGLYRPVIAVVLRYPGATLLVALGLAASSIYPWSKLGSEFMPPLNEGDLLYMPTTPPGISITAARALVQQTDRIIAQHPQVQTVLGKAGRANTATDPAPLSMLETTIRLRPESEWPEGKTVDDVIRELDAMVQFPGLTNAWTMPIKTRIDMLATGIKTPVGVKLLGDDLAVLSDVASRLVAVLRDVPGTASVYAEEPLGGNYVDIRVRRGDAARYGLNVADVQDVVNSAIGGMNVTETVEGLARYPVNVRFPRELRDDVEALRQVAVPTPLGHTVPLAQVADIEVTTGPPMIQSENARRTTWVLVDLSTDDLGGYVERAKAAVERAVPLPEGVAVQWAGQYEYLQRSADRLAVVLPVTLSIIFILLYVHFRRFGQTFLVMGGTILFAPIGGAWLLYLADFNLSVAARVGFIALAGLAAETGVVMIVYLDEACARYAREGRLNTPAQLSSAIIEGAVERVRPKLMTVATTMIGLLPVMFGNETGVRVMKRIAAPMVGGLVSSTMLTLIVLPAAYLMWRRASLPRSE